MIRGFCLRDWFSNSKKKVEISIETKKTIQIRLARKGIQQYCPICRNKTLYISVEETKSLIQTDTKGFEILIATGNLHLGESSDINLLICLNSLKLEIEKNLES